MATCRQEAGDAAEKGIAGTGGVGEDFQGEGGATEDPAVRGEKHGSEFTKFHHHVAGAFFEQDSAGFD